jgi:hypothetical protein
MKTVQFNPNGGPLIAKAVFLGNMIADYGMYLKQSNSNSQTTLQVGDNINPEDDEGTLPTPVSSNDGRRVKLETIFYGNNPSVDKEFEIRLEMWQDGNLVGFHNEQSSDAKKLTGGAQYSLILITLNAQ